MFVSHTYNIQCFSLLGLCLLDSSVSKLDFEREVAFSQEYPNSKTYVQDILIRDAAKIYDMWIR